MNNMELWSVVEKTDPKHVKPITGKAYSGNSPKPYYIVHRATEIFGPCGIGWGFEIVEEKILQGAIIDVGFYEQIHMARIKVWYKWKGERGEVEHVGQTTFSGKRRDGKHYTDEDAPKKSITDALIKALSMIGFAGDIFMGRFDDSKYVEQTAREFRAEAQSSDKRQTFVAATKAKFPGATVVEDMPFTDAPDTAAQYVRDARAHMDEWTRDAVSLWHWWQSEEPHREAAGLSAALISDLEAHMKAKVNSLRPKAAV